MNNIYKRREGYWGVISIPDEYLLEIFSGRVTVNSPEQVKVYSVYTNHVSRSLDVVIQSDHEIPNVTFECYMGTEIPRSHVSFDMNKDFILKSID